MDRPERQLTAGAEVVRRRTLEAPAEVLVAPGTEVAPEHIVAQGRREGEIRVVDVAAGLRVGRREAKRHVVVEEGQWLAAGTIVAQRRVLLGEARAVWAPVGGTVETMRDGLLLLRSDPCLIRQRAHLMGRIAEVLPERGVAVRAFGHLLAGAWGAGGEARGPLYLCPGAGDAPPAADALPREARGAIALCGPLEDAEALRRARAVGLAGLVVSSIRPDLAQAAAEAGLPVMSVEGFGRIPWAAPVLEALADKAGRTASLSGVNADGRYGPELVVALDQAAEEAPEAAGIDEQGLVGATVRLTRAPHAGIIGRVIALPERVTLPETDLPGPAAEVRLDDGTRVVVPWVNLVVLA